MEKSNISKITLLSNSNFGLKIGNVDMNALRSAYYFFARSISVNAYRIYFGGRDDRVPFEDDCKISTHRMPIQTKDQIVVLLFANGEM